MIAALAWKEFRELGWLAALATVLLGYFATQAMEYQFSLVPPGLVSRRVLRPDEWHAIPFVTDSLSYHLGWCGTALGLALGLRQTLGETWFRTWLFLLHRPIPRWWTFAVKLLVGGSLMLIALSLPVAMLAWWAATPGNHASPFEWRMTLPAWQQVVTCLVVYLATFQCGLRPARWYATRLLPLAAAVVVLLIISTSATTVWWTWLIPLAAGLVFLVAIFSEAEERDHG